MKIGCNQAYNPSIVHHTLTAWNHSIDKTAFLDSLFFGNFRFYFVANIAVATFPPLFIVLDAFFSALSLFSNEWKLER